MKITVHPEATPIGLRLAPALLCGGSFVIALAHIGLVPALLTGAAPFTGLFLLLRLYPRHYRNKAARRAAAVYTAEANWKGMGVGVLRIGPDDLEFTGKQGQPPIRLAKQELESADLSAVNRLVRATRATLTTSTGEVYRCTITGPAGEVAEALSCGLPPQPTASPPRALS